MSEGLSGKGLYEEIGVATRQIFFIYYLLFITYYVPSISIAIRSLSWTKFFMVARSTYFFL